MKIFSGCVVILAVCFFLCCGVNTILFYVIPTINQNKWNELKPQSYSITLNYGTFGGVYTTVQERVTGDFAWRREFAFNVGTSNPTIEGLFNRVKGQTLNPFAILMFSAEYDPTYGYPVRIQFDDLDMGRVTEITDFTVEE